MSRVLLISRDDIGHTTQMQTVALALEKLGLSYDLFCRTATPEWVSRIQGLGGKVFQSAPSKQKLLDDWNFRRNYVRLVGRVIPAGTIVWIFGIDVLRALRGLPCRERVRYIVHVEELYDRFPFYRWLMRKYLPLADVVVVPEAARAHIIQLWCDLREIPLVLPNKPIQHPRTRRMEIHHIANRTKLQKATGRKLVIYQSRQIRLDLRSIGKALNEVKDEYAFGLMGNIRNQEMFNELREICPDLIHFEYMPPPEHLTITSHAFCGVLLYTYESLNNIFCAPNKVWEYSGFGIPMICNRLPMLGMQLELFSAGTIYDPGKVDSIIQAIKTLSNDYQQYSKGAECFFNQFEVTDTVAQILARTQ